MENLALDGAALEHAALSRSELVKPRREQRLDGRRDADVVAALRRHRNHLLDEERVTARRLDDALTKLVRSIIGQRGKELRRFALSKRLKQYGRRVELAASP